MDQEFSDELTGLMPVVPHGISGVDCSGCIIAAVEDNDVELRCNACGAVVGVVQVNIMEGLLGLDCAEATSPHCGKVNTFSSFSEISTYVCDQCGKPIAVICCQCGRHPDVDGDGIHCPCGRRSYVGAPDIVAAIAAWNQMPSTGE